MDSKIKTTQQPPATPAVASKDGLGRIRIKRTILLFMSLSMTGMAFDIGRNHPVQAAIIMWGLVLPILYVRECLRPNDKAEP